MAGITLVPPDVVRERHAKRRKKDAPRHQAPRALNTKTVLDLGNQVFYLFRGRPFGVPAIPHKAGLDLADLQAQAQEFVGKIKTRDDLRAYRKLVEQIPSKLWRLVGRPPGGWVPRLLHRLHLLPNPFRQATEAELGELLDFFLKRRMTSSVLLLSPAAPNLARRTT